MDQPPKCKTVECDNLVKKDAAYPKRWTLFCSRSCASKHTRNFSAQKIKDTCMKKYGGVSYLSSDKGKQYLADFYIERYGVDNPSKSNEVKETIQKNRKPYKSYDYGLPSGRIIRLQGYENIGLDILLEKFTEDQIVFGRAIPSFAYELNGKRLYYPDFYVPSANLIVEVKSTWTMRVQKERNLLKEKAVISNGFNFQFLIFDAKGCLQLT
jgi:hypothetical protein